MATVIKLSVFDSERFLVHGAGSKSLELKKSRAETVSNEQDMGSLRRRPSKATDG